MQLIWSKWSRIVIVALIGVTTLVASIYVERLEQSRTHILFRSYAEDGRQVLTNRIEALMSALDGLAALFAASDNVTAEDWRRYVETMNVGANLPGVLGMGFIVPVSEDDLISQDGELYVAGADLPPVHPNTGFEERFIVKYIEPLAANREALALDITFEEGRRAAAERARETGMMQLTPPIELIQGTEARDGFLLIRPVFEDAAQVGVDQDVATEFKGWVYTPFLIDSIFSSLFSNQDGIASLTATHADDGRESTLIYQGAKQTEHEAAPLFSVAQQLEIHGDVWTLTWNSTPRFEATTAGIGKWMTLALGLSIAVLVALMLRIISRRERQIEIDVRNKTQELRARAEETQSVVENAVISIFVLDRDDMIVSANQAAYRMLSLSKNCEGDPISDHIVLTPPEGGRSAAALPATSPHDPALKLMVQRNHWNTADGEPRTTMLVQDVSEAEASAAMLEENEARWNLALQGAEIGVFDIDLTTNRSIVSDTWRRIMDVPLDATEVDTQRLFLSRILPEDREILAAADKACINGETERSVAEYRVRFDNGTIRWMRSDAVVVARDEAGNAKRMVGAQTDITALKEARDALRASRERFQLVLEQAPVGMGLFDSTGQFLGMNDALCAMTGYREEEMWNGLRFNDLVSHDDLTGLLKAILHLKGEKRSSYQQEYQIIPKTGDPFWGLMSVAWTYDSFEGKDIFIVQINDITEKKSVERMKSEFVSTVSHELRTPLTSIKGALGLLRGTMLQNMPTGAERLLEIAGTNTDRLVSLVNDILDLEKISAGDLAFHIEPSCIGELVSEGVEQMLPFALQHKCKFVTDLPTKQVLAAIDPARTQQVIANLLSNACKYSDDNTDVRIRLEIIEKQALIFIINQGPGISDEFRNRIFEPFSQADASDTRAKGGTGLGLNISRQIIERMGGRIGFDSRPGGLTTFWFSVPLAEETTADESASDSGAERRGAIKLLHLEDDCDFSEIVRVGLEGRACTTSATTIQEARIILKQEKFDVIVVDWTLSDGDARDILDEMKRLQPQARIISLSANESRVRDIRVHHEMIKSRTGLEEIVSEVMRFAESA